MTKYDVAFVQSGTPTPPNYKFMERSLPRSRIDLALQLYANDRADCLVMIGTGDQVPLMKKYALMKEIPSEKVLTYPKSPTTIADAYYSFRLLPNVEQVLGRKVRSFAFVTNEEEYKTVQALLDTFARLMKIKDVNFEVLSVDSEISVKKKMLRYGISLAKRIKNSTLSFGTGSPEVILARDQKFIPDNLLKFIRYVYDL